MKFAAFDIDGTLIRWQLYHAIADALVKRGYIDSKAYKAIRDARMTWKKRQHPESFKQYEIELITHYDSILASLSVTHYLEAAEAVFEEYKDQTYTYTRDLLKDLKQKNYMLFAISGSQTEIIAMMANYYGFDDFVGSFYPHENGRFVGKKTFHSDKSKVLKQLIDKHGVTTKGSLAVGDSFGDIKMLELVEQPIAFNPEQNLFKHAKANNWKIVVERKNMVYKLEPKNGKYQLV